MTAVLAQCGAAGALAHVLVARFLEAQEKNIRAGIAAPDAREAAERNWLMLEPEK